MQENFDIRTMAKEKNVPLWKIADKLKMSQANFFIKLRYPLEKELKNKIIEIINKEANHG